MFGTALRFISGLAGLPFGSGSTTRQAFSSTVKPPKTSAAPYVPPQPPKTGGATNWTPGGYNDRNNLTGAVNPSTGGQSTGGGGFDTGGYNVSQPQEGQDDGAYVNELRNAFSGLRSSIEGQMPTLDSTYNQVKSDIEGGLNRAKETFGERKEDITRGFGENLRSVLLSDRELGQKNRNVYSGLNALDSSSYAETENKRQQSLFDTKGKLVADKERQLREGEREYGAYEAEANRVLAQSANEYMQGKNALQQALAQNKLDEAYSIQNAMDQIRQRAQQTQDTLNAFKLNLAQLQAQGTNVMGNLGKLGATSLNNIGAGYQTNTVNPGLQALNFQQPTQQGQGYIGKSGRRYNSVDEAIRAGDR